MDKQTKITDEQINSLVEEFSDADRADSEKIDDLLSRHLTKQQSESVKNFLKDEEKVKKLLSSPFAKAFMSKYINNNGE